MSGRPIDPSYALITWDTGNYPAGGNPWNGTAKRTDPAYRSFTPGTLIAPQYHNYFLGAGFDLDASHKAAITGVLDLGGQLPALNWQAKVTTSSTRQPNRAAFGVKDQVWWGVGNGGNDFGVVSYDYGRTWADVTLGSTLALLDVAVDTSGNVSMVATGTQTVYKGTRSAYGSVTFAATASALPLSPSGGALAFESTVANFVLCYRNGTSGQRVATSANATTWTGQTIPSTWTSYTGTNSPTIHAANTFAVAAFYDDGASLLRIMRSTDGGVTWSSVANIACAFTPTFVGRPTWNDARNVWYIVVSTASGRQSQIFSSSNDAVTWASAISFTSNDLFANGIVAHGDLLVMANDDGRIAYSYDNAATWKWAGRNPQTTAGTAATPLGLRGGGGGLLLLNAVDKASYASLRFGNDGQAV